MTLPLTVRMDYLTFMWIQIIHLALEPSSNDDALLAALIQSPHYAYDYASPFDPEAEATEPAVHGRWWRDRIHADLFEPCAPENAERTIQSWADDQDWTDPSFRQPPPVQEHLRSVYALLRSGVVYHLQNPGPEAEHEYGSVTGGNGFHEFVVIDRGSSTTHLLVATDD